MRTPLILFYIVLTPFLEPLKIMIKLLYDYACSGKLATR